MRNSRCSALERIPEWPRRRLGREQLAEGAEARLVGTAADGARPVGASGLCVGGVAHAVACVEGDVLPPSEFKFFFNEYIWLPGAIEQMVDRDDDGSFSPRGFLPLRLDTRLVLRQQGKAGKLWSEVRRLLRSRGISLSRDDAGEEDAQSA